MPHPDPHSDPGTSPTPDQAHRPILWRALTPKGTTSTLPMYLYWNADTNQWGRFDQATRYPHTGPHASPGTPPAPPPHPASTVTPVDDLARDNDGYPYKINPQANTAWRVSSCCAAMPGIDDGPLYCKSCYEEVDLAVDAEARLDANWNPGDGPIRIELPPQP